MVLCPRTAEVSTGSGSLKMGHWHSLFLQTGEAGDWTQDALVQVE